jgi:hypothetical protein
MASPDWPAPAALLALHARLLTPDRTATADFASAVLAPLVADLRVAHPQVDDDVRQTAAADAVCSVLRDPAVYDPRRRTVAGFLRMAAEGDLRNALKKEARHHRRRESADCVEVPAPGGNDDAGGDPPAAGRPDVRAVLAGLSAADRKAVELMADGVRETAAFAAVFDLTHLPPDRQRAEVKRHKDRIKKHLARARGEP